MPYLFSLKGNKFPLSPRNKFLSTEMGCERRRLKGGRWEEKGKVKNLLSYALFSGVEGSTTSLMCLTFGRPFAARSTRLEDASSAMADHVKLLESCRGLDLEEDGRRADKSEMRSALSCWGKRRFLLLFVYPKKGVGQI